MCHLPKMMVLLCSSNLMFFCFFYPQSCPPPCRWIATWRNRSTCGRITHPTSWQRRPSMLQWQHSNHTVLSVHSSVPTLRYSYTLQQRHICVSEVIMLVIVSAVPESVFVAAPQVTGSVKDVGHSVVNFSEGELLRMLIYNHTHHLSSGPSSHRKMPPLRMTPPCTSLPPPWVVHWSQRCALASVQGTPSLHPPTITLERMEPVFCSAVHLATCRFMPVSIKPSPQQWSNNMWSVLCWWAVKINLSTTHCLYPVNENTTLLELDEAF